MISNTASTIYPWHENTWNFLVTRKNQNNLPHALIFTGVKGLGKFHLAKLFGKLLLCNNSQQGITTPCDKCNSCNLINVGNHPDLILVEPEESGKPIKIDQIRGLIVELCQTAQQGSMKIAIINSADLMNLAASNALLKTLEEPAEKVLLILVTEKPMTLPATIRSRCQNVIFHAPTLDSAKEWLSTHGNLPENLSANELETLLKLTNNSALQVLEFFVEDKRILRSNLCDAIINVFCKKMALTKFSEAYLNCDSKFLLAIFFTVVSDLAKIKLNAANSFLINQDKIAVLKKIADNFTIEKLWYFLDKILEINNHLLAGVNLNKQLLLEEVLFNNY
jgi:DNA polymerase III subunit delta'